MNDVVNLNELGLVGNCQISALVRRTGSIVWSCMPRFDAPPVFGALLDAEAGGQFLIGPAGETVGVQRYLSNTNVLETRFESSEGAFRVLDFAPRFMLFERAFRPTMLVRIVEPLEGTPRVRAFCEPVKGWSRARPSRDFGSHHISYHGFESALRLTTDAALSHIDGAPFALTEKKHFVLTWGQPVEEPLESLCERFLRDTIRYWRMWVKHCDVPALYQEEVIRSALALKLHCFEDTGAIVAAQTTSIPEAPGSARTWDYRYCWLRDAYYVLAAFRLLGHFEEREQFIHFLLNAAASSDHLAPLYRIDGKSDVGEKVLDNWAGFEGHKPVRIGNEAAGYFQYDVFGEMVLALTPMFLDARFREQVTKPVLDLVTRLARQAVSVAGRPDSSIWEPRTSPRPQTFSSLMCWAGAERMSRIAKIHAPGLANEFLDAARRIREEILREATEPKRGCLVADYGGAEIDAALLQAIPLRFYGANDGGARATIDAVRQDLEIHGWLRRYRVDDGFGVPTVAFTLCTFWLIEALAATGRLPEARTLFERARGLEAPLGLLAEDVDPTTGRMWGNYPQAYSHVGLIHAAFASSPRWID